MSCIRREGNADTALLSESTSNLHNFEILSGLISESCHRAEFWDEADHLLHLLREHVWEGERRKGEGRRRGGKGIGGGEEEKVGGGEEERGEEE